MIKKSLINPFIFINAVSVADWSDPVEGWSGNALLDFLSSNAFEDEKLYYLANARIWVRGEKRPDDWVLHRHHHAYGRDVTRALGIVRKELNLNVGDKINKDLLLKIYYQTNSTTKHASQWEAWDYVPHKFCQDFEEIFLEIR